MITQNTLNYGNNLIAYMRLLAPFGVTNYESDV